MNKNKPAIRFKGFTDDWKQYQLVDESIEIVAGGDIDNNKFCNEGKYPILANTLTNDGIIGYYKEDYRIKAPAVTITGRGNVGHAKARNINFTPVIRLLSMQTNHNIYFMENAINMLKIIVESTGVPQLTVPQFEKYKLFFPQSENEEKYLGEFFKYFDSLISFYQCKCEKLKDIKKAMLEKMFPKKGFNIPEIRFEGFTDNWKQCQLKKIVNYISSSLSTKDIINDGKYKLFDANGVIGYTNIKPITEKYITIIKDGSGVGRTKLLSENTIFISTMGGILAKDNININFLFCCIKKIDFNNYINGATIPHIYFSNYGSTLIYITSLEEQKKIGTFFKYFDSLINLYKHKCEKLKNIKKAMLEKMFV